jgi:hypothetical protein
MRLGTITLLTTWRVQRIILIRVPEKTHLASRLPKWRWGAIPRILQNVGATSMTSSSVENSGTPRRKRSTFVLTSDNYEVITETGKPMGLNDNAALNVALTELREWRTGTRTHRRKKRR